MLRRRRSIRLKEYDYSQPGMYFVTACVKDRMPLFGRIENGRMTENEYGGIIRDGWDDLPNHYDNIRLDAFVVMANHIHGIIVIIDVGAIHESPLPNHYQSSLPNESPMPNQSPTPAMHRRRMLLPKIVGRLKTNSGKCINQIRKTPGIHLWQRNYFEHIIRTDQSLERIRKYIVDNPRRWNRDTMNNE